MEAYACGADDVLLKPVREEALAKAIGGVLGISPGDLSVPSYDRGDQSSPAADIHRSIAYMECHLGEPLSIHELASVAHMSVSHFIRCFKSVTGTTPNEYLQTARVSHARKLLLATGLSVSEVAARCGFQSISYFSQLFRRQTGMTPTEWRAGRQK